MAVENPYESGPRVEPRDPEGVEHLKEFGYSDPDVVELATTAGTAAKFANFALPFDI
jgi:hypothetical protein